jgi:uncharacterized membrane protein
MEGLVVEGGMVFHGSHLCFCVQSCFERTSAKSMKAVKAAKAAHSIQNFICMTIRRKSYQMATQHAGAAYGMQFVQSVPQACVAARRALPIGNIGSNKPAT